MVIKYHGKRSSKLPVDTTYVVKCGKQYVDAAKSKCITKYVNHSCTPNCRLVEWQSRSGEIKLSIVSIQKITMMEEITIHYGNEYLNMFEDNVCKCDRCTSDVIREIIRNYEYSN